MRFNSYDGTKGLILFLKTIGVRVSVLAKFFEIPESTIYSWNKKDNTKKPDPLFKSYIATEIMPRLLEERKALESLIEELKVILDS